MALANTSFPVPVSPLSNTVTSVAATILALRIKESSEGDCPIIDEKCAIETLMYCHVRGNGHWIQPWYSSK